MAGFIGIRTTLAHVITITLETIMTNTRSADDIALLKSRRSILGAIPLAALATTALIPVPALAGESEVEIAYREFVRLGEIELRLWRTAYDLERANPDPEPPKLVPFDAHIFPPGPHHDPVAIIVSHERIELLRRILANRLPPEYDRNNVFGRSYDGLQKELDLTVACVAERDRRRVVCGLTDAKEKAAAAKLALEEQRAILSATPARTLKDLALKARAIRDHDWDDRFVENVLDELITFGGPCEPESD